jgi:hypothetical protein
MHGFYTDFDKWMLEESSNFTSMLNSYLLKQRPCKVTLIFNNKNITLYFKSIKISDLAIGKLKEKITEPIKIKRQILKIYSKDDFNQIIDEIIVDNSLK